MNAYIISDLTERDAAAIAIYRARASAAISQLWRAAPRPRRGDWGPRRKLEARDIVVVEFPDVAPAPGIALPSMH